MDKNKKFISCFIAGLFSFILVLFGFLFVCNTGAQAESEIVLVPSDGTYAKAQWSTSVNNVPHGYTGVSYGVYTHHDLEQCEIIDILPEFQNVAQVTPDMKMSAGIDISAVKNNNAALDLWIYIKDESIFENINTLRFELRNTRNGEGGNWIEEDKLLRWSFGNENISDIEKGWNHLSLAFSAATDINFDYSDVRSFLIKLNGSNLLAYENVVYVYGVNIEQNVIQDEPMKILEKQIDEQKENTVISSTGDYAQTTWGEEKDFAPSGFEGKSFSVYTHGETEQCEIIDILPLYKDNITPDDTVKESQGLNLSFIDASSATLDFWLYVENKEIFDNMTLFEIALRNTRLGNTWNETSQYLKWVINKEETENIISGWNRISLSLSTAIDDNFDYSNIRSFYIKFQGSNLTNYVNNFSIFNVKLMENIYQSENLSVLEKQYESSQEISLINADGYYAQAEWSQEDSLTPVGEKGVSFGVYTHHELEQCEIIYILPEYEENISFDETSKLSKGADLTSLDITATVLDFWLYVGDTTPLNTYSLLEFSLRNTRSGVGGDWIENSELLSWSLTKDDVAKINQGWNHISLSFNHANNVAFDYSDVRSFMVKLRNETESLLDYPDNLRIYNVRAVMFESQEEAVEFIPLKPISSTIEIFSEKDEITAGEKLQFTYELEENTVADVIFSVSSSSLATIDSNGVLTAKAGGEVTVSALIAGTDIKAEKTIKINAINVTSINVNKTTVNLKAGQSEQITTEINPSNATDKALQWSVADDSVATVSRGKITAVSKGTTVVTITSVSNPEIKTEITVIVTEDDLPDDTPGGNTNIDDNNENNNKQDNDVILIVCISVAMVVVVAVTVIVVIKLKEKGKK